ncbi:hypothetical protein LLH06_18425 [Mucilaginibacter daejeonensis]|uniref:hypothetical protein n=1 Tax=Mucilaginibacter daejeonensis TaxID=398049 RepID=UPI001D17B903|nr:hypothetical protein [Mucilaginibacter daejeonensis]UEG52925.1 hypothetical protein LLH06_18425 [Mucilaginibacter daejeonensis]
MNNHIHILWRKQDDQVDKNIQLQFSKYTGQQLKFSLEANYPHLLPFFKSTQVDRAYQFWERRPYKATMYNRIVLEQKLEYIHDNPVKANLCDVPENYEYSSAAYYVLNAPNKLLTHYMEHM